MEDRYCQYSKRADLFSKLHKVCNDNRQFFASGKKAVHSNFFDTFEKILNFLEPLQETLEHLESVCSEFDLAEDVKGNGFRSLICITEKCLVKILEVAVYIQKSRDRFFFRSHHFYMEIDSFTQVISRLFTIIQISLSVRSILENGSLFPDEEKYSDEIDGLMDDFETIERECFYGRSFAFQFSPALQQSLQVVAVAMAAYGDGFKQHDGSTARALSSVLHSGKYLVNPELRAKRIVELTKHASVPFCKAFWSLTENHGIQHVPMFICPNLAINKEIAIFVQALEIPSTSGMKTINPSFLTKPKKILTRLLSYSHREGQGNAGNTDSFVEALGRKTHGLSKNLVIHCHGGGFVAQSSKSHEIYLRGWAKELDCPILSIDYSLSPDAPYPEALNECFYVYVWALLNSQPLGTTAERICLTGDSAGANLMVAVTLKAIEAGIRIPDGLAIAYPPMRVQYMASPSRLLCLMDPLLPPGILKVCLRAYAGEHTTEETLSDDAGSCKSLRTFEHSYNPFDVDLGDGAFWARRSSCVNVTGKRSYSDSNLVMNGQYSARLQQLNDLRRKDSLIGAASKMTTEAEVQGSCNGLRMHSMQPVTSDGLIQRTCIREENHDAAYMPHTQTVQNVTHATHGPTQGGPDSSYTTSNKSYGNLDATQDTNRVNHDQHTTKYSEHGFPNATVTANNMMPMTPDLRSTTSSAMQRSDEQLHTTYGQYDTTNDQSHTTNNPSKTTHCEISDSTAQLKYPNPKTKNSNRDSNQERYIDERISTPKDSVYQTPTKHGLQTRDKHFENMDETTSIGFSEATPENFQTLNKDTKRNDVRFRRGGSKTPVHHRRSLSDSLAECFYRLSPKPGDCSETSFNNVNEMSKDMSKDMSFDVENDDFSVSNVNKNENTKTSTGTPTKTEFSAVFHKETDDCRILGNEKKVSATSSFCELRSDDAEIGRKSSSDDSISSSIKRRSRDPFMSPLLAPDHLLLKMPLLLTVACTLDPLLDDAIEFTRRLKKLDKHAELFIVDDLPHGFLNFNFASSEAKEASDLLAACIKRILKIGIKHENSFPANPDEI